MGGEPRHRDGPGEYPNADRDTYTDCYALSHRDTNFDGYCYRDTDCDSHGYSHRDTDSHRYSDRSIDANETDDRTEYGGKPNREND